MIPFYMQHSEVKPVMQYCMHACFIIGIITTNVAVRLQVELINSLYITITMYVVTSSLCLDVTSSLCLDVT